MKYLKLQTLTKGWHDRDEILLHACFQVLVDFMEQEKPERIIWNVDELQKNAWKEIKSLYNWWKRVRPARKSPLYDKKLRSPPMKWRKIPDSDLYEMVEPDRKK